MICRKYAHVKNTFILYPEHIFQYKRKIVFKIRIGNIFFKAT